MKMIIQQNKVKIDDIDRLNSIITALRESDRYIPDIFMQGGCYQFHLFIKSIHKNAECYISATKDHIATKLFGKLFDIMGEIDEELEWLFKPLGDDDLEMVKKWSSSKYHCLSLGDCSFCGEHVVLE